jgi:plasmid stabilization system protein ParE
MKYEVVLTDEARQNVRAAVAWYAQRSPPAADRWYSGFLQALESLAEDPQRCPLARENPRKIAANPIVSAQLLLQNG